MESLRKIDGGLPRILVVDDDPSMRRLLRRLLSREHEVEEAGSGEAALTVLSSFDPGLVLLDIAMPGMDGYETCRQVKLAADADLQVIMVSARSSREEQLQAYEAGADDYVIKPIDPHDLISRVRLHLQLREANSRVTSIRAEIDSRNLELKRLAEARMRDIIAVQDVTVFTLAKVAESRDQDTAGHLTRMRAYSQVLAEQLARSGPYRDQINGQFLDDLYRSSPLHDIGKVGIRDEILLKPGRLTSEEFEAMKQHTLIGADILDQAVSRSQGGNFLVMAALIARFHHERYDGKGYPARLAKEEIPLPARIVALADVYDALTSVRPYKEAMSPSHARTLIDRECGYQFDPAVVRAFHDRFPDFLDTQKRIALDAPTALGAMSFRGTEPDHHCPMF